MRITQNILGQDILKEMVLLDCDWVSQKYKSILKIFDRVVDSVFI